MTEPRLKILPPWSVYIKKLTAIFDPDPMIAFNVDWNGNHPSVTISTNDAKKAAALKNLLPMEKVFGNISLTIDIDCKEVIDLAFKNAKELFETVFKGNPVFSMCVVPEDYWYIDFTYVLFKNEVVQIKADNLLDPRGFINTLYQDIASEVFVDRSFNSAGGIAFCTDIPKEELAKPLGEWP